MVRATAEAAEGKGKRGSIEELTLSVKKCLSADLGLMGIMSPTLPYFEVVLRVVNAAAKKRGAGLYLRATPPRCAYAPSSNTVESLLIPAQMALT